MAYKTVELAWFRSDSIEYAGTKKFEEHSGKNVVRISEYTSVTFALLPPVDVSAALREQRLAAIEYHETQVALLKKQAE